MKVIKQLFKEFFLPLLIAVSWTAYSLCMKEITLVAAVTIFGPAFFLASWLVGQFFRVKKQVGVEKSLSNVEGRLEKLADSLKSNVGILVGHLSGGDSFCYLRPNGTKSGKRQWQMLHCGQYPMHKFIMRLVDIAYLEKPVEQLFKLDEISVGSGGNFVSLDVAGKEYQEINVFFESRSGSYYQEIRFATVSGVEIWAFRVGKDYETLLQVLPENFPLSLSDKRDWLSELGVSGLKKEWSIDYSFQELVSN